MDISKDKESIEEEKIAMEKADKRSLKFKAAFFLSLFIFIGIIFYPKDRVEKVLEINDYEIISFSLDLKEDHEVFSSVTLPSGKVYSIKSDDYFLSLLYSENNKKPLFLYVMSGFNIDLNSKYFLKICFNEEEKQNCYDVLNKFSESYYESLLNDGEKNGIK